MVDKIFNEGKLTAVLLRAGLTSRGIEFYTPTDCEQQLGAMAWPKGHTIAPHVHNEVERTIMRTQEVLVIHRGRVRVDLYGEDRRYLESRVLDPGDIILLASGGHGFTILEDAVIVEIKQGPYVGLEEKIRFEPVDDSILNIRT